MQALRLRAKKLKENLFKAVDDNDMITLTTTIKLIITDMKQKINDKAYRQPDSGLTVLAYAINLNRDKMVDVIMKTEGKDIFLEKYDYDRQQLNSDTVYSQWADQSFLTCIHLLAAKGKNETVRLFIRLVPLKADEDFKQLQAFLSHSVYQDIGRQYAIGVSTKRLVTALHIAVATENLELIDILLKQGVDPDVMRGKDFCHASPLAITVENDNLEAFRRLADISKTFKGPSRSEIIKRFLQIATSAGSLKIVEELLKLADANQLILSDDLQDIIDTSSLEAIRNGYTKIYEVLLHSLDPNKLKNGLLEAIKRDNKDIVENLLGKGAPVDDSSENCETSPLAVCVSQEKADILPLLMQKADHISEDFWKGVAKAKDDFSRQAIEYYRKNKLTDEHKLSFTNHTTTPMHIAASLDKLDTLLGLISLGARRNLVDENGDSIMHTAAQNGSMKVLAETLDYYDPNMQNRAGDTVLALACKNSRPKIIEMVLSSGKDINWKVKNVEGDTILHLAVKQLNTVTLKHKIAKAGNFTGSLPTREDKNETVQLIIQHSAGANILDEEDSDGNTALNLIVQMRREADIPLLASADPTIPNKRGYSAIDVAMDIYEEQPRLIETLLKTFPIKAAIHLAKEYRYKNYPPLHQFAKRRDIENVKLLVQHGASVLEQNDEGQPIFHALIKLAVQNDTHSSTYIKISQTIIDALVEFRIPRQQEVYRVITEGSSHLMSSNSKGINTSITNNKKCTNDCFTIPLLEKNQHCYNNSYKTLDENDGTYFVAQTHKQSYDVKRALFVYLTRVAKNGEKQTALNYAIHLKAKDCIEFLLDIKENAEVSETASNKINQQEHLTTEEYDNNKEYFSDDTLKNGEHEDVENTVKLVPFLYDVTCLTPETIASFDLLDRDWIETALQENYLQQVLIELKDKMNQQNKLSDAVDTHASKEQASKILSNFAQHWGLQELFHAIQMQKTNESKKTESKQEVKKIKKHRKKTTTLKELSALETIVNMSDEVIASELLNKIPLTQLVESYWSIYRWIYFVIMVVHVIYMWIFSSAAIDTVQKFTTSIENDEQVTEEPFSYHNARVKHRPGSGSSNNEATNVLPLNNETSASNSSLVDDDIHYQYVLLLLYPVVMLTLTCYFELIRVISWYRLQRSRPKQNLSFRARISSALAGVLDWPYKAISFILECLTTISCLIFTICMFIWYVKLVYNDWWRNYFLSICLIFGWLLTINYTRGFQSLHTFKNIMKGIVLSDILRFLMVYVFILIGFSLGFHVLLGYLEGALEQQPTPAYSVFFNLRNFLSPADIFQFEQFSEFDKTGGGIYVKIAYLIFSFLLGLILINILIAMMNDSYIRGNEMEQMTFRLGSLRQALVMFRCFPIIIRLKERLMRGNKFQVAESLLVPQRTIRLYALFCEVQIGGDRPPPTVDERLDHIEREMKVVYENIQDLSKQMQAINDVQDSVQNLSRQIQETNESREDTKALFSAIMVKLDECTLSVKALNQ